VNTFSSFYNNQAIYKEITMAQENTGITQPRPENPEVHDLIDFAGSLGAHVEVFLKESAAFIATPLTEGGVQDVQHG
jgi:hypothetical protein